MDTCEYDDVIISILWCDYIDMMVGPYDDAIILMWWCDHINMINDVGNIRALLAPCPRPSSLLLQPAALLSSPLPSIKNAEMFYFFLGNQSSCDHFILILLIWSYHSLPHRHIQIISAFWQKKKNNTFTRHGPAAAGKKSRRKVQRVWPTDRTILQLQ